MPKFLKKVLRPTKYFPRDMLTGERKEELFTPDRIKHLANRMDEFRQAGLKIYCPIKHDGSNPSNAPKENLNFGEWKQTLLNTDGSLNAELDVPLEEDAKRIGKTIKEVSPYIVNDWKDGNGRIWPGESILHITATTHTVDRNQDNFVPLSISDTGSVTPSTANPHLTIALADFVDEDEFIALADESGKDKLMRQSKSSESGSSKSGDAKGGASDKKDSLKPDSGKGGSKKVNASNPDEHQDESFNQNPPKTGTEVSDLINLLSQLDPPVIVPTEGTDDTNIVERVCICLTGIIGLTQQEDEEPLAPKEQPSPIAMSDLEALINPRNKIEELASQLRKHSSTLDGTPTLENLQRQFELI